MNNLLFPRKLIIDNPGIIINKFFRMYGEAHSQIRTIFYFEDILVNLQLETIKELGKERASELFYRMGKDMGKRYLLLAKAKKPPSFLLPLIIEHIFMGFRVSGLSLAENIKFNKNNNSLILEGDDSIVSRKSKDANMYGGIISSFFSFLIGENIEAESFCENQTDHCRMVLNPENKQRYVSTLILSESDKEFYKLNFPSNINYTGNMYSFKDLMKFKKISILKEGKFYFKNRNIIPTPIDFPSLISSYYLKDNREILERGLINGAESITKDLINEEDSPEKKIKNLLSLLCALGWGFPTYKIYEKELEFTFLYPPLMKKDFLYPSLVLNGFINYIFKNKFLIKKTDFSFNPIKVKIQYSVKNSLKRNII